VKKLQRLLSGLLHVISRGTKLNRVFTASDRKFDVGIGTAAFGWNLDVNTGNAARERNSDVSVLKPVCMACSSTFNFVTNLSLALWLRKTAEHPDRVRTRRNFRVSTDIWPVAQRMKLRDSSESH
jgi:hypothetical protein